MRNGNNIWYVYRHIREDKNQPFYIGIGCTKNYSRSKSVHRRNVLWKNIINKTSWYSEILMDNLTKAEACKKEIEFIQLYGRRELTTGELTNMTNGGEGSSGHIPSENTRNIMKKRMIGKNNPFYGKKHSNETIKKLSELHKKGNLSEKTLQKMSFSSTGKRHSEKTKKKIGDAIKGHIPSEETRKKQSLIAHNKKSISVWSDATGEFIGSYHSIREAARQLNLKVHGNGFYKVLNGDLKSIHGYVVKYLIK